MKVGVNVAELAVNLSKYGLYIENILDLRYLAQKCNYPPERLALLAANHLNVTLTENHRLDHKHWTKPTDKLDIENVKYAAQSVHVAIELFKKFEIELTSKHLPSNTPISNGLQVFIKEYCKPHLNHIYQRKKDENVEATAIADRGQIEWQHRREIHVIGNVNQCQAVVKKLRAYVMTRAKR